MSKLYTCFFFSLFICLKVSAQCCSGGSGNPMAGGSSQGVLEENQFEINTNYQHLNSNKFLSGDTLADKFLEDYRSNYAYFRIGYGITKALTLSIENGYFFDKTEIQLNHSDTIMSGGISDLIIFPRFNLFSDKTKFCSSDLVLGIGSKISLGSYNDSLAFFTNPKTGISLYMRKPPGIQATSGAQDFIFYGFYYKSLASLKMSFFSTAVYIKKGWNPDGEKMGDYASLGLFLSKSFGKGFSSSVQFKGEYIGMTERNKDLPFPNYIVEYTGGERLYFVPQISYTSKYDISIFALTEIPLYQKVNGIQIASDKIYTAGIAYRFKLKKKTTSSEKE